MLEAAARTTKTIEAREKALVDEFKKKGLTVTDIDKADFEKNVIDKVKLDDFGYEKADWEAIRALK
jgi:TRAP-type C4-dicarboxylate transport system substrate-binding protein